MRDKSEQAIEQRAKGTIEDLREGLLDTATIRELGTSAKRALADRGIRGATDQPAPRGGLISGRPWGL